MSDEEMNVLRHVVVDHVVRTNVAVDDRGVCVDPHEHIVAVVAPARVQLLI